MFDGRHALITGGGSGIGAATARALAGHGAKLSLLGRRADHLDAIASETGGHGFPCDVTDRAAVEAAFIAARAANGPIHFLIVNAGIGDSAPFDRTQREAWDRIIAVNLTAAFDCAQFGLGDLLAGQDTRLIFIASVAGLRGAAFAAPYAASKHGVVGLSGSLAKEFAKSSMTVNAVCPGFTDTAIVDQSAARISTVSKRSETEAREALAAFSPQGRIIDPDEVAAAICALCTPASRSINGIALPIDGGATA